MHSSLRADIRQFGFGTGTKAREFLETRVKRIGDVDQEERRNIIVNQIKNLPVTGRVPRGVDQVGL